MMLGDYVEDPPYIVVVLPCNRYAANNYNGICYFYVTFVLIRQFYYNFDFIYLIIQLFIQLPLFVLNLNTNIKYSLDDIKILHRRYEIN